MSEGGLVSEITSEKEREKEKQIKLPNKTKEPFRKRRTVTSGKSNFF